MDADLSSTMASQSQSDLFSRIPREIRDMIYVQLWEASGPRQHVFEHEGGLTHSPCLLDDDEEDTRNKDFEAVWHEQQGKHPQSMVRHVKWARRMASTWNEHWRCEEAMLDARAEGKRTKTLFLPSLLTCKRMYHEALPSLYSRLTLVLTSLPLSHTLLVSHAMPHMTRLCSLHISVSVPYADLHNHSFPLCNKSSLSLRRNTWAELCATLSDMCSSAALRDLSLRIDLEEDNRFWWEVRETFALGAISGPLRKHTRLYLPELTVDVDKMRPFQFAPSGGKHGAQQPRYQADPFLVYPLPVHLVGPKSQDDRERQTSDFKNLTRYSRRRWMAESGGEGIQARLEFFSPREHAVMGVETVGDKMRTSDLFRGMLMS